VGINHNTLSIMQHIRDAHAILGIDLNVGTYQGPNIRRDIQASLQTISDIAVQAVENNLDLVLFPELFLSGYDISVRDLEKYAVNFKSPEIEAIESIARNNSIAIGVGYSERDDGKIYNSCCVFDATGTLVLNYRKTHLWDPSRSYEKTVFTPGWDLPIADMFFPRTNQSITIGVLICFDCEFPEPARALALKGASVILIPTAIAAGLVDDITPRMTVPCRAAENHVFVVYSNLSGSCLIEAAEQGFTGCEFCGQSAVIGPDGRDIIRADKTSTGLFHCRLRGDLYHECVRRNDYLAERNARLYGSLTSSSAIQDNFIVEHGNDHHGRSSTSPTVFSLTTIQAALPSIDYLMLAAEHGFKVLSAGHACVAPVQHLHFPNGDTCVKSGFRVMSHSAGCDSEASCEEGYFVTKVASGHPSNTALGLNASSGVMMVFSQNTGKLKAVLLDDGYLTDLRTAVVGCLSVKHFGPQHITKIGIFGTGTQARFQLEVLQHVTSCREVLIWGRDEMNLANIKRDVEAMGYHVDVTTCAAALCATCNVIFTVTSSKQALFEAQLVQPGSLIVAIGADGGGKQELDPEIFSSHIADLVLVDSKPQCISFGDVSHAIRSGVLSENKCIEIGHALTASEEGCVEVNGVALTRAGVERGGKKSTVIFDSTGVAIQDVQIAEAVYRALSS
jgi:ornithine cyclodeaminase